MFLTPIFGGNRYPLYICNVVVKLLMILIKIGKKID